MEDTNVPLQNWLADDEKILTKVDNILFKVLGWSQADNIFLDADTPIPTCSLFLTNHRLIISDSKVRASKWYSVTGIAGLSERAPGYAHDNKGRPWPYQARLTLYSGVVLILETPKDNIEARGRELSKFLVAALVRLSPNSNMESSVAAHLEEDRRQEEERRRRD